MWRFNIVTENGSKLVLTGVLCDDGCTLIHWPGSWASTDYQGQDGWRRFQAISLAQGEKYADHLQRTIEWIDTVPYEVGARVAFPDLTTGYVKWTNPEWKP